MRPSALASIGLFLVASSVAAETPGSSPRGAAGLVAGWEEVAGRPSDAAWRARLEAELEGLPRGQLAALVSSAATVRSRVAALVGSTTSDLVYTPVTPCRVIDTRLAGAGGALVAGSARAFYVAGSTGFGSQGGNATGCGVPLGPSTAALLNFIAVAPAGAGNLRAWAWDSPVPPPPNASVINYDAVTVANGVAVPICVMPGCSFDLMLRADVSSTHVVADVVGYFSRFPKEQVKPISVVAVSTASAPLENACGDYVSVTVNAPGPGQIVVDATAHVRLQHVAGEVDWPTIFVHRGAPPGTCSTLHQAQVHGSYILPSNAPDTNAYDVMLVAHDLVAVSAAASFTFTLVGRMQTGHGADDSVQKARIHALFVPD